MIAVYGVNRLDETCVLSFSYTLLFYVRNNFVLLALIMIVLADSLRLIVFAHISDIIDVPGEIERERWLALSDMMYSVQRKRGEISAAVAVVGYW